MAARSSSPRQRELDRARIREMQHRGELLIRRKRSAVLLTYGVRRGQLLTSIPAALGWWWSPSTPIAAPVLPTWITWRSRSPIRPRELAPIAELSFRRLAQFEYTHRFPNCCEII